MIVKYLYYYTAPFFLLITLFEAFVVTRLSLNEIYVRAIADTFGLNVIHIAFTFIFLFKHESFKGWAQGFRKEPYFKPFYFTIILFFILSLVAYRVIEVEKSLFSLINSFNIFFWFFMPKHHVYSQSLGLALNMGRDKNKTDGKSRHFKEKRAYSFIVYSTLLLHILNHYAFFDGWVSVHLGWVAFGLCLFTALTLLYVDFLFNTGDKRMIAEKRIFNLRFFLLPLSLMSPVASVGIGFCHGFEYLWVYCRIKSGKFSSKSFSVVAIISTVLLLTLFMYVQKIFQYEESYGLFFGISNSILLTLIALHYGLDHCLYSMRYRISRKYILPSLRRVDG